MTVAAIHGDQQSDHPDERGQVRSLCAKFAERNDKMSEMRAGA